ncbi:BTAD domain-containing putative transcriptional regulator [Streptomyces sp. NPDC005811]|uniref:AfsR/SARP family transcriptional regulator n=1 Tax=Streptomyces sp. NPDC005811 TaxID=3154565 RepID=UPI0033DF0374
MRVTVLGPLRAWREGTELELGPPKRKALLALLLTQAGRPVLTSEIVEFLWRESAPDSAVNVVHRHIGVLRGTLGPVLVRASGGYRLQLETEQLDLLRFRALRARAAESRRTGDDIAAVRHLLAALALWQGPVADGLPPSLRAHPLFSRVEREYPDAVKEAVDAALQAGDVHLERLLTPLRQAARAHPLDEALHARLVTALARTGHTSEARRAFEAVGERLDEELGLDPGPELTEAAARLHPLPEDRAPWEPTGSVSCEPTGPASREPAGVAPWEPTDPAPWEPADPASREPAGPGSRQSARPAPLESADPGAVSSAPSAAAPADGVIRTRPAQLPPDLGVFSGRKAEMALARRLLPVAGPSARSVVISAIGGMAGVGKTTLAIHWAHEAAPHYPDGQLYADLRGFDPGGATVAPAQVLRSFLDALGVAAHDVPPTVEAQTALYRSLLAGRRVLVVLDNARDTEQVRPLLPGADGCLAVVTSRDSLSGLVAEGARPIALDVLDESASRAFLVRRLGAERLAARPDAVRDIVQACAGLPLALAIVGARLSMNPYGDLDVLAAELTEEDDRLGVLSAGDPATDLRTVFSWSYRALTPLAARLFRLLALHPGPEVSPGAAAGLLGLPPAEVRPALAELAGARLLTERFADRFHSHDLLRAYAGELLRTHDTEEEQVLALRRLLDHLLHSAYRAVAVLAPRQERPALTEPAAGAAPARFHDREEAAHWLETERAVVLAAVAHGPARAHAASRCWQLAATVELHLDRLGRWQEQLTLQSAALDAAERSGDRSGRAHAHRALGFVHGRLGDAAAAVRHLTVALELFGAVADRAGAARTQRYLAFQANRGGRYEDALAHYGLAHTLYTDAGSRIGQAQVHNEVGWTHILRGDHARALVECRKAIDLHQQLDDPNGEAAAWDSLGYAHHHLAAHERAIECYRRALTLYRWLHDASLEADTLVHIGDSQEAAGDRAAAGTSWRQALRILERLDHPDARTVRERLAR